MSLIDPQLRSISGSGGGSGSGSKKGAGSASNPPDTLRSDTIVNIVDALGEGPIVGLVNGLQSIYLNGTPVQNTDLTPNYVGIEVDERTGTPDQAPLTGSAQTSTLFTVETQVKQSTPVIRTVEDSQVTAAQVIIRIPALMFVDNSDGTVYGYSVEFQVQTRASGADWVTQFDCSINNQKVSSPYKRQFVVNAPGDGQPWDIRVVRMSADQDPVQAETHINETWWESYAELTAGGYTYDDTALVSLTVDAFTFGSNIGERLYDVRGLIIDVPANYDPPTRTYTGIWDGTFKSAYANNPAWVFWDVLTNNRYGLGEFVDPLLADKWTLFTIGQYCDQLVPSGFKDALGADIMEPRYSFNGVINNREEAYKVLQNIASIFRGMAFWSLGQVFASADMPSDPVASFSPANVVAGHFRYSGTAMKSRHSVAVVQWNDPKNYFRTTPEIIQDHDMIRQFGWRQTDIKLLGCASRGQALRFGKWILDSEKNQTETVQFSISWDNYVLVGNQALRPGQIILISDPRKNGNYRMGGRLAQVLSTTSMVMDQVFAPQNGQSYTISALLPDGSFETHAIQSFGVDGKTVTLSTAFTQAPVPQADFILQATNLQARQYRVLAIQEDESGNTFKVTALVHDPNKYARVENGLKFDPIPYVRPKNVVGAPSAATATEVNYFQDGSSHSRVTVGWTGPADFSVMDYLVTANTPHGFVSYPATTMPVLDINDAAAGAWEFFICARSMTGVCSVATSVSITVKGWQAITGPTPTGLRTAEGNDAFTGKSPTILWTNAFPANSVQYAVTNIVRVYDANDHLLRTERVQIPQYTYDYDKNVNDGGPRRALRFDVTALNITGVESPIASINVANPTPAKVTPTVTGGVGFIDVKFSPNSPDYAGAMVWARENGGYAPVIAEADYNGPDTIVSLMNKNSGTWYVWVGLYDTFGTDGMIISDPVTLSISSLDDALNAVLPDLIAAAGQVTTEVLVQTADDIGDQIAGVLNQIVNDRDWNDQLHARHEQILSVKTDTMSAMVTEEQTARIEADFAEATARQVLEATINGTVLAQIATESTARASADSALTTQINSALSKIGTNTAAISTEATTRATADSANAALITALTATVNGNTASITSEASTRASADSANAALITALTATVNGNTASITSEASTRASADSANASSISSLSTTVGSHTSTLSTLSSSVNGMSLEYGVIGNIDGVTGGFLLTGIKKNDGSVSYTVEIEGNLIVDGTVGTNQLAANSITTAKLAAQSVDATILKAGSVTAANGAIAALAVKSLNIAGNAVTVPVSQTINTSVTTATTIASFNVPIDTTGLTGTIPIQADVSVLINWQSSAGLQSFDLYINGVSVMSWPFTSLQPFEVTMTGLGSVTATGGVVNATVAVVMATGGVTPAPVVGVCKAMAVKR